MPTALVIISDRNELSRLSICQLASRVHHSYSQSSLPTVGNKFRKQCSRRSSQRCHNDINKTASSFRDNRHGPGIDRASDERTCEQETWKENPKRVDTLRPLISPGTVPPSLPSVIPPETHRKCLDDRCAMAATGNLQETLVSNEQKGCPVTEPCPDQLPKDPSSPTADPCPMMDFLRGSSIGDGEKPPPYFPQPEDSLPAKSDGEMGPIGPWATGRTVFTPGGGFTGLRPICDRYSITQFSPGEWRAHNETFFKQSNRMIHDAQLAMHNGKNSIQRVFKESDSQQQVNKERLITRAGEVFKWKGELERALIMMTEEIDLLETEYRRVKSSLSVLTIPESISGEFLQLRSTRLEPDLVRDEVNDELIKELGLCTEIRELLGRTKEQIERQTVELKSAKARMEFDWTDKKDAYEIDTQCIGLANNSPLIMWKAGSARIPGEQSTPSGYEHMTREALAQAEATRERSATLRTTLDAIYVNSVRDLRTQADRVDAALAQKVTITQQCCERLEKELLRCLYEISNIEETIKNLRASTRNLDNTLKVAQTRLDNRLLRRNVESCRDVPQFGLIEEVKTLGENVSMMMGQIKRAEESQMGLVKARGDLEREIIVKRKSLYVDRDRGQLLRSFYPSAVALSGHT